MDLTYICLILADKTIAEEEEEEDTTVSMAETVTELKVRYFISL